MAERADKVAIVTGSTQGLGEAIARRLVDEAWLQRAEQAQPFGRLIKPAEVAEFAAFLLSPRGGLMTGSIIDFDQNVIGTQA
jgi:NAD(P)-dependent dehydrogenase (short-subunit alcohol dehydrogenase family)